ncbi:serine/threonine-protein kinase [Actinokineospora enzanensis]|uniref:serine/threonine-protein kinase n=1 Tax=Actinokineospora enzanensis TaxID=155975 RepID=UPI0003A1BDE5|nr:serine/threonine-protein kinase [Actinokineospora enzanensis]
MSEDLTGRRLGHYRIDGVLGKGGMSVMYRATDMRLGRKVALKVIAEHLTEDPEFRERFVDEARNTSAIDHANVVPLYDFGEVDGLLYIAMRLVDGSDMASLIKNGPLAPQRALSLLGQVAEALDNLHERGLVHLDVKPANVLVTARESANEHIYLADFGLTRRGATGHRTRGGDFLGSPTYAAPEHLRGEPVDGRTDAYSLACVLFACLTGRPPFQGQVAEVIQGHLNREVPALTDYIALPPAIDDVVRRGMAKTPGQRYSSCRKLVAAARQALSGMPPRPPMHLGPNSTLVAPAEQIRQHYPPPHMTGPHSLPQPVQSDPVRLRPPVQVRTTAFDERKSGSRWIVPVIVGLVAIGAIVAAILLIGGDGGGGDPGTPDPQKAPSIPVGPERTSTRPSTPPRTTTHKPLPSITIVPPP